MYTTTAVNKFVLYAIYGASEVMVLVSCYLHYFHFFGYVSENDVVVPGPVQSLRVSGRGSYHVTLRWALPREPNGILIGYIVGYRLG